MARCSQIPCQLLQLSDFQDFRVSGISNPTETTRPARSSSALMVKMILLLFGVAVHIRMLRWFTTLSTRDRSSPDARSTALEPSLASAYNTALSNI